MGDRGLGLLSDSLSRAHGRHFLTALREDGCLSRHSKPLPLVGNIRIHEI